MADNPAGAVVINGLQELQPEDMALLHEALVRIRQHQHVKQCTVWCAARGSDEWLELLLCFEYDDGSKLTVGALQRDLYSKFEFHS